MYAEGADYVFMPRILTAKHIVSMIDDLVSADPSQLKSMVVSHIESLKQRDEVIS